MSKNPLLRRTLISTVCCISIAAYAVAETSSPLDVPAGELVSALKALASQVDVELVYQPRQLKDIRTDGVKGAYSPQEAIAILLKGTDLRVYTAASGAMVIAPISTGQTTPSQAGITDVSAPERGGTTRLAQADTSGSAPSPGSDAPKKGPAATAEPAEVLEEITVTAQKRVERLQDVPISISVLSGESLDRATAPAVSDALIRVPGVGMSSDPLSGGTQLSMRGVAAASTFLGGSNPVAYYLDGVPFGLVKTAFVPDSNAYDLERIEVLRGPQGTLYGANALNGVVRVLTHEPDLDSFDAKTRVSLSSTNDGDESYRADVAVNAPLVPGKLAARAVVGYQSLGGWIDNTARKDTNDSEVKNFRLKLRAQPTDAFSIGLTGWRSRSEGDAPPISAGGDFYNGELPQPTFTDYDVYGLQLGYDFAGVSLSSATSYIDYNNGVVIDITPLGAALPFFTGQDSRIFTQEVNLRSASEGSWRWTAGAIYRDGEDHLFQNGVIIVAPFDFTDTSQSYAVYGELTRRFAEGRVELTGGLRYFEDDVGQIENTPFSGDPAQPLLDISDTFHALTPRVVLSYHKSDRTTLYASYAQGFRSGYNQTPIAAFVDPDAPPVKEDTLTNYELGAKSSVLDGRLTFDGSVYYIDWQDVQQVVSVLIANGNVQTLATEGINGSSATGVGFDLSLGMNLLAGLELGASISWNNLELDGPVESGGTNLFVTGERLNFSSKYTVGASMDYVFPLSGSGFRGRLSALGTYISPQASKSIIAAGSPNARAATTLGDQLIAVRGGFSIEAPRHWTATLFVENATDESSAPVKSAFTDSWDTRVRPRTIGLQFEYRF